MPSLANLLFIETLEAIHAVLRPQGLEVLIGNFHYSRNEEEDLIRNYLAYQPRGLLLTGFERTESARRMIEASGIPCVYMMDLDSGSGLNCVGFSQLRAGEAAAEHLLATQPQAPGLHRRPARPAHPAARRGVPPRLAKGRLLRPGAGNPYAAAVLGGPRRRTLRAVAGQPAAGRRGVLLQRRPGPGALLEALRRGVKVPEQIAVLGFNDLPGSDCTVPRLSSIRTPREAIGRRAAEQLLALIAGKEVRDSALDMGFELMAREST